jgi:phosphatidylinositol kinase/protein kinase (PI-3  family)
MEVDIVSWSACWRCVTTNLCVDIENVLNMYDPKLIGIFTKTYFNLHGILQNQTQCEVALLGDVTLRILAELHQRFRMICE